MAGRSLILIVLLAVGLSWGAAPSIEGQTQGDPVAGRVLYHARCAWCHGQTKGLPGITDQQMVDVIKKGGPALGKSNAMMAFPRLSNAEVSNLVAYIRTLAKKP
jgi:mono/diheme cytochrome c family protein